MMVDSMYRQTQSESNVNFQVISFRRVAIFYLTMETRYEVLSSIELHKQTSTSLKFAEYLTQSINYIAH